jgi:TRAP-type mannitol/chloroaromatic compound transport system substrate-binding protein
LNEGGGLEVMREVFADFNIIIFPAGNTGGQMGGWFRREVNSVADLRGLKMRIPGLGAEVMDRLGVTVQVLAGGDIFPALERGAIDATEWVGPYDDEKLGLHQAAPYYYYPGWWEPSASMSWQVNIDAWNALPAEYQAVFEVAARSAARQMLMMYDARNPAALQRLVEGGTQLRRFSNDILTAARDVSVELMESKAAADPGYQRVYDHWREFRDASFRWFSTTESAYAEFAFGAGDQNA